MAGYHHILPDKDPFPYIARLTINRPWRRNALMEMAQKIAAGPPIAMRLSKLMLYQRLDFGLETAMKMTAA